MINNEKLNEIMWIGLNEIKRKMRKIKGIQRDKMKQ